ncbi:MAG: LysE family translocator [Devosia sp.]
MFDLATLLTFTLASAAIVIVPGPTVSVIIANSLRRGASAGLANVVGTQIGLAMMILVLAAGLDVVVAAMGAAFVYIKLAGAAYLVYLGIKLWRSDGELAVAKGESKSLRGYTIQGIVVIWSNPKALFFFGAFIPQFVNPSHSAGLQVAVYGAIFMAVATVLDGCYAFAAGKAGSLINRARVRFVERLSGSLLILGGVWLAFTKR